MVYCSLNALYKTTSGLNGRFRDYKAGHNLCNVDRSNRIQPQGLIISATAKKRRLLIKNHFRNNDYIQDGSSDETCIAVGYISVVVSPNNPGNTNSGKAFDGILDSAWNKTKEYKTDLNKTTKFKLFSRNQVVENERDLKKESGQVVTGGWKNEGYKPHLNKGIPSKIISENSEVDDNEEKQKCLSNYKVNHNSDHSSQRSIFKRHTLGYIDPESENPVPLTTDEVETHYIESGRWNICCTVKPVPELAKTRANMHHTVKERSFNYGVVRVMDMPRERDTGQTAGRVTGTTAGSRPLSAYLRSRSKTRNYEAYSAADRDILYHYTTRNREHKFIELGKLTTPKFISRPQTVANEYELQSRPADAVCNEDVYSETSLKMFPASSPDRQGANRRLLFRRSGGISSHQHRLTAKKIIASQSKKLLQPPPSLPPHSPPIQLFPTPVSPPPPPLKCPSIRDLNKTRTVSTTQQQPPQRIWFTNGKIEIKRQRNNGWDQGDTNNSTNSNCKLSVVLPGAEQDELNASRPESEISCNTVSQGEKGNTSPFSGSKRPAIIVPSHTGGDCPYCQEHFDALDLQGPVCQDHEVSDNPEGSHNGNKAQNYCLNGEDSAIDLDEALNVTPVNHDDFTYNRDIDSTVRSPSQNSNYSYTASPSTGKHYSDEPYIFHNGSNMKDMAVRAAKNLSKKLNRDKSGPSLCDRETKVLYKLSYMKV